MRARLTARAESCFASPASRHEWLRVSKSRWTIYLDQPSCCRRLQQRHSEQRFLPYPTSRRRIGAPAPARLHVASHRAHSQARRRVTPGAVPETLDPIALVAVDVGPARVELHVAL